VLRGKGWNIHHHESKLQQHEDEIRQAYAGTLQRDVFWFTWVAKFLKMGCTGWLPFNMRISLSTPMPVPNPGPEMEAMELEAALKRIASCSSTACRNNSSCLRRQNMISVSIP
jgi:hypothetical protein